MCTIKVQIWMIIDISEVQLTDKLVEHSDGGNLYEK